MYQEYSYLKIADILSITSKKKKKADIYLDEARIGSLPESLRHNVGLLPLLPSDWY